MKNGEQPCPELPLSNSNPKQENSNFFLTNFWGKF